MHQLCQTTVSQEHKETTYHLGVSRAIAWRIRQTYISLLSKTQQPSHTVFEHYKFVFKKLTKFLVKCSKP